MASSRLGRTLVIANPASHSGQGAGAAQVVRRVLNSYAAATDGYDLWTTGAPGDAQPMAAQAAGYDTIVAVGGDGVIHEVVCGLMEVPAESRPRLGVIPFGSGNDLARTLGLVRNDAEASLAQLLSGVELPMDLGYVTSDACSEGTYFAETLSFGLDAAIAQDTTDRRAQGTKQQGSTLFLTSSLKAVARARSSYPCVASIDGGEPQELDAIIFAVQNGPTYGGGFRICPDAQPHDGLLDLCHNVRHPGVVHLLLLLGLARFGLHTRSRVVNMSRAGRLTIDFGGQEPPCQVDGEPLAGSRFEVSVASHALRTIIPRDCIWNR